MPGNTVTDRDMTNSKKGLFGRKGASGNQPMAESGQGEGTTGQQAGETV